MRIILFEIILIYRVRLDLLGFSATSMLSFIAVRFDLRKVALLGEISRLLKAVYTTLPRASEALRQHNTITYYVTLLNITTWHYIYMVCGACCYFWCSW